MANDKTFSIGNNGEITSVRFGIYADEDIKSKTTAMYIQKMLLSLLQIAIKMEALSLTVTCR